MSAATLRNAVDALGLVLERKRRRVQQQRLLSKASVADLQLEHARAFDRCVTLLQTLASVEPEAVEDDDDQVGATAAASPDHRSDGWLELERQTSSLGSLATRLDAGLHEALGRLDAAQQIADLRTTQQAAREFAETEELERRVAQAKQELRALKDSLKEGRSNSSKQADEAGARIEAMREEAGELRERKAKLEGQLDALRLVARRHFDEPAGRQQQGEALAAVIS